MIYVLFEIHDFSSFKFFELEKLYEIIPKIKINIAITPFFNHQLEINKLEELIDLYKEFDLEFGLHGFYHDYYEFSRINPDVAKNRIEKGIEILKNFGKVNFFIPPNWGIKKENLEVVKNYFDYFSTLNHVYFKNKRKISPLFIYGFGDIINVIDHIVSKGFKILYFFSLNFLFNSVVRIVVHPSFFTKKDLDEIFNFLNQFRYKFIKYSELDEIF